MFQSLLKPAEDSILKDVGALFCDKVSHKDPFSKVLSQDGDN